MAIASGFCMADPSPMAKAKGSRARMAANVVIVIGRLERIQGLHPRQLRLMQQAGDRPALTLLDRKSVV